MPGERDCDMMTRLTHSNNSCYLDSVLVALLHQETAFCRSHILSAPFDSTNSVEIERIGAAVQRELMEVQRSIRRGTTRKCSYLRTLFKKYDGNDAWIGDQLEPLDVVHLLIQLFNIPDTTTYRRRLYGHAGEHDRDGTLHREDCLRTSFVIRIETGTLLRHQQMTESTQVPLRLSDIIPEHQEIDDLPMDDLWFTDDRVYSRKREIILYTSAPLVFLHVDRGYRPNDDDDATEKNTLAVIPDEHLVLGSLPGRNAPALTLTSIIVHHGETVEDGHYTCCYRCKGIWYEFDDMESVRPRSHVTRLGTFAQVVNTAYLMENAVDFVYTAES